VILNIGGIANLTRLPADPRQPVIGFDSGPGNRLLDDWIASIKGEPYDCDGAWAASGEIDKELLQRLLDDPWFSLPPPKSTGTERFNLEWLDSRLGKLPKTLKPGDVQATLLELTAVTIVKALHGCCPQTAHLLVCGGGAHNPVLMARIAALLPKLRTSTTALAGSTPTGWKRRLSPGLPGAHSMASTST
jgi:anhydro-N-acetylmuramic acid kinase